jgi:predicted aldo/keto reductase-like oxidoreductase
MSLPELKSFITVEFWHDNDDEDQVEKWCARFMGKDSNVCICALYADTKEDLFENVKQVGYNYLTGRF